MALGLIKLLHLAAAIVWMGGMGFMLLALRPAAMAALEAPLRARLMLEVWQRFFVMVWVAIALLLASGLYLYLAGAHAGPGWQIMLGLGLTMFALFGHLYFAGFRRFRRALAAGQGPVAAQAASLILRLVWVNFTLGWLAIAAVRLWP